MNNKKELLGIIKTLDRLNKDFENNRLRVFSSNRVHSSKYIFFRYIAECKDLKKYSLRDIVVNYFNKVEKYFPGSSYLLSKEIVSKFLYKKSFFENNFANVANNIENFTRLLINNSSEETVKLVKNILQISGPDSTVLCKSYPGNEILVKKKNSSKFNVCIEESMVNIYFNKVKETSKSLQTCVLDAYIERESEIIPLIDHANLKKLPVLLFCRGISNNAINALKKIIIRNNIYVYPYIVKFDNSDPFLLKDIAAVLNVEILSSETGDSIYKDIIRKSKVKEVKLSSNFFEIKEPNQEKVFEINKKIKETNDSSLKNYLLKRKARYSSNITEVSIPSLKIEKLNEIKNALKCYNHAAAFGLIECNEKIYSKSSVEYSIKIAKRMFNTLNNIDVVISRKKVI